MTWIKGLPTAAGWHWVKTFLWVRGTVVQVEDDARGLGFESGEGFVLLEGSTIFEHCPIPEPEESE